MPETPEMKAEWDKITEVLALLNADQDTKEIFEDVIEARETYGIAYLEVIRNLAGEAAGVEFIKNTPSITKTPPLLPYIDIQYEYEGKTQKRQKKFRKYKQETNGNTVYFKEIGDPRIMDARSGTYGEGIPLEYQANEILEFAIGTEAYGEVRWSGQILGVDGSLKAENSITGTLKKAGTRLLCLC
jgi:capsid portal protein